MPGGNAPGVTVPSCSSCGLTDAATLAFVARFFSVSLSVLKLTSRPALLISKPLWEACSAILFALVCCASAAFW